jgi:hypothetical protein
MPKLANPNLNGGGYSNKVYPLLISYGAMEGIVNGFAAVGFLITDFSWPTCSTVTLQQQ